MKRTSVFTLIDKKYDIKNEIKKIDKLFKHAKYFEISFVKDKGFSRNYTFARIVNILFPLWKKRGATSSSREFMKKADAGSRDENAIINYLEVIENYIYLYTRLDTQKRTYFELGFYHIENNSEFNNIFCYLVNIAEQRLGLSKKIFDDYVLLYPTNATLEKVLIICNDNVDAQWELIRYTREKLSLSEKQKSLAYFATVFAIEKRKDEKDSTLNELLDKATNILNNLKIRHTNNDEISVVDQIGEQEQIALCDYTYSLILTIILLREQEKYKSVYSEFHNKQKEYKEKKKKGDSNNG